MAGSKAKLVETARRNRVELVEAGLSRRDLVRLGLVTASGYLVSKLGLSWRAAGSGGSPRSPQTTPWVELLPVPPVARALRMDELPSRPRREADAPGGEAMRAAHQYWELFDPANADCHLLENAPASWSWHRELPLDPLWCWNGGFPGPRIQARYGRPVLIRFQNHLPALDAHVGYGRPTPSTHLHGAHAASESDGGPLEMLAPGAWKDQLHLNRRAGFTDPRFGPHGDVRESLSTLWYHDQSLSYAAQNVYRGNVGLYELFGELDSGDENDAGPAAWRLPSGDFDVPLVFHDRSFDADGHGTYDLFELDGVLGDTVTVNGRIRPFLPVARRKYRFRLLNAGPSRHYDLFRSDAQPMTLIGRDGCLLPRPLTVTHVRLAVGQRAELVLDLGGVPSGTRLQLVNCAEQRDGLGPTGATLPLAHGDPVLLLVADGTLDTHGDPSRVPERFLELPPTDPGEVATERTFVLERPNGGWTVNGRAFDPDVITARPRRGTAEIWNLVNRAPGVTHAVHLHLEQHQVLSRNGQPPPPEEAGRSDVVRIGPGETVTLFQRFRDFTGHYAAHGASAVQAEQGAMFLWNVVP